jgi:hypothetical protein
VPLRDAFQVSALLARELSVGVRDVEQQNARRQVERIDTGR